MADRGQVLAHSTSTGDQMLSMCWLGALLRKMAGRKSMPERMAMLAAEARLGLRVVRESHPSPCRCPACLDAHLLHWRYI